jgi:hypothetical protein
VVQVLVASICEFFFVGLLAGVELGVHDGVGAPPSSLSENAQIVIRQAIIRRLRILAPAIFLPAIMLAALISFEERRDVEVGFAWSQSGCCLYGSSFGSCAPSR